ncbi:hypothetical protein [Streptomyces sp. NPDC086010]|uniref:hypothetical protein n=1 Tax=Streptomyces sp. NPDC086010 TaxID=3365745 RepID=UPI0037D48BDC
MLRHVIAPSRRYTKASHDVVRHTRLNSDAKILLLAVQGLPDGQAAQALSEHARKLGIKGRAYQKSKALLIAHGYVHEWRGQGVRGHWRTEQLFSSVPLTPEEAALLRRGASQEQPSAREPAVGRPTARVTGRHLPVEEELGKTIPHPPSEADPPVATGPEPGTGRQAEPGGAEVAIADAVDAEQQVEPDPGPGPEFAQGERVLLSLRHVRRELYLGAGEARSLAGLAARWLLRGVSEAELRTVLTTGLPGGGVRSAAGFLRFRLLQKMPPELPPETSGQPLALPPVAELTTCSAPGEEHVFRPVGDETECGECRRQAARAHWEAQWAAAEAVTDDPLPWRERFARLGDVATPG